VAGFQARQEGFLFSSLYRSIVGPIHSLIGWVLGEPTPGILLPEREADYSSSSSFEVKKSWSSTSFPYAFLAYTATSLKLSLENMKHMS